MPKKTTHDNQTPTHVDANRAAQIISEYAKGKTITKRWVTQMCKDGKLKGAYKVDPSKLRSVWLIPYSVAVEEGKKRAQA